MIRSHWTAALLALVIAGGTAARGGEEPALAPQDGVLLLTHGQVLEGNITRAGDYYLVTLPQGEIRIRAGDVDLVCNNLDEGYQRKRAALSGHQIEQHLELAQWCIQHKLLGYAAKELVYAMQLDPKHPRLRLIERSLEVAREVPEPRAVGSAIAPTGPSNEELDRLVRSMPPGTVETFTQMIQPLLLNSCTTAGCHGPASTNKLRLFHISQARVPSRRLTQRNLYMTLGLIDMKNPEASPLLKMPLTAHGSSKTPVFSDRNTAQYEQLVAWVRQVTKVQVPPQAESVDRKTTPLLQTIPKPDAASAETPVAAATESPKPATPAKSADTYTPVDEFDAEVFNRRYLPKPDAPPAAKDE